MRDDVKRRPHAAERFQHLIRVTAAQLRTLADNRDDDRTFGLAPLESLARLDDAVQQVLPAGERVLPEPFGRP